MATPLKIISDTVAAPNLLWDTVWDGQIGDWAPARSTEPHNRGGLRARAPLETAILLCLATDARLPDGLPSPDGSGDPRGWPGDNLDPDVAPIGSLLWTLRRSVLDQKVADRAVIYARMALQTLIDQGAVATIDVVSDFDPASAAVAAGRLNLGITLYRQDGAVAINTNFSLLWDRNIGVQYPLDR